LAQAILESATSAGWGSSSLFRIANNPFGIKYEHYGAGNRAIEPADRRAIDDQERPSTDGPAHNSGSRIPDSEAEPRSGDSTFTIQDSRSLTPNSLHPELGAQRPAQAGGPERIGQARVPSDDHSITGSTSQSNTGSPSPPIIGSDDHSIPDPYGAFDAQTWEIVNGQKKVIIAQFQRFPNLTEAFKAHAQLLWSPRYRPAFAVRHDWKQFAERLGPKSSPLDSEHCGYSTNPSYSAELIKLIELYRLNDSRAVEWFATGVDPGRVADSSQPAVHSSP
jgi:hypothetical protein